MDPTQCLRDEHQVILKVLSCFERALGSARDSADTSAEIFSPFVEFFRGYADDCHHKKEEDRLFPMLESKGLPHESGPVGCMLDEHAAGRAHVGAIAAAIAAAGEGDTGAIKTIVAEGEAYIDMLRSHIGKEDNVLFQMAAELIQGDAAARLTAEFEQVASAPEYVQTLGRCRAIAEQLIETYTNTAAA